MKKNVKPPCTIPNNQWTDFYFPKEYEPIPTKRFPNKVKSKSGKIFFLDKYGHPYIYVKNEKGKPSMSYLSKRGWWSESTSVSSPSIHGGISEKKPVYKR